MSIFEKLNGTAATAAFSPPRAPRRAPRCSQERTLDAHGPPRVRTRTPQEAPGGPHGPPEGAQGRPRDPQGTPKDPV